MLDRISKPAVLTLVTAGLMANLITAHAATASDNAKGSNNSSASKAAASNKLDTADRNVMNKMAQGDLAEIAAAKLAESKSQSDEVKGFAHQMIGDHAAALNELAQLAQSKGVSLPTTPDAQHQAEAKKMSALSGAQFDRAYMAQAGVKDHHATHQLLEHAAKTVKDPDLKAHVTKILSVVDTHLQTAQQINSGKKATTMGSSMGSGSNSSSGGTAGKSQHAKPSISSGK